MRRLLLALVLLAGCSTSSEPPALSGLPVTTTTLSTSADHLRQPMPTSTTTTTTTAPPRASLIVDGDVWYQLFGCETGYTYNVYARSPNGLYFGAFQFDLDSWARAGGSGHPLDHGYDEQKRIAIRWMEMNGGFGPWPHCAKTLGLPV